MIISNNISTDIVPDFYPGNLPDEKRKLLERFYLHDKLTLKEILEMMDLMDDEAITMNIDDMQRLGEYFTDKVDNYYNYKLSLEAFLGAYDRKIDALQKAKKRLERRIDGVENAVMFHMKQRFIKTLQGDLYEIKYVTRQSQQVEITSLLSPDKIMLQSYPDFVRHKESFEWNKVALKKALDSGDEKASELAKIKFNETESIKFGVKGA